MFFGLLEWLLFGVSKEIKNFDVVYPVPCDLSLYEHYILPYYGGIHLLCSNSSTLVRFETRKVFHSVCLKTLLRGFLKWLLLTRKVRGGVLVEGGVVRLERNREGRSAINEEVYLLLHGEGIGKSTNSNFV